MTREDRMALLEARHAAYLEDCDECFLLSEIRRFRGMYTKLSQLSRDLPPEYEKIFHENFQDLLA